MSHLSHRLLVLAAVSAVSLAGCASYGHKHNKAAAAPAGGQAAATDQGTQAQPLPAAADKGSEQPAAGGNGQAAATGQAAGAAAPTAAKTAAAAPPPPPPPPTPSASAADLATLEDKLKHYPRILWHTHDDTYQFYVGTVLFARYDPYKDVFTISTDNADLKNLVCTHQPDTGWKVDGQIKGASCDKLLKELSGYLAAE